ncbi:MAG: glycogen synthase [Planctomycetota bacterium]
MSERIDTMLISYEAVPFAKVGGLGDVAGALPDALAEVGIRARLVMPRFAQIDPESLGFEEVPVPADWHVGIDFQDHPFRAWRGRTPGGAEVWMLGDERHFGAPGIYADPDGRPFPNELERMVFFAKGALELAKCRQWRPRVIHANDFQTALSLAYVRQTYAHEPAFAGAGLVYSIHNLAYQGVFPGERLATMGFGPEYLEPMGPFEFHGAVNLMKVGISYADVVHTVSPTYAREILGSEQGAGLEGVLEAQRHKLVGILNGIDEGVWNPADDPALVASFDRDDPKGKAACRADLLSAYGLGDVPEDWPVVGFVGRLVAQKGVELITGVLDDLLATDAVFVALGTGAKEYEDALRAAAARHPDRCGVRIGFDDALAHRLTAGADLFLMPSRYEPCGLNQMYAQRYGTIPVVRRTGGLADTVEPFDAATGKGTGFLFDDFDAGALADALGRAIDAWSRPADRARLRRNGMGCGFGWSHRAPEYRRLYERAMRAAR